jgi:hypothetical protein
MFVHSGCVDSPHQYALWFTQPHITLAMYMFLQDGSLTAFPYTLIVIHDFNKTELRFYQHSVNHRCSGIPGVTSTWNRK